MTQCENASPSFRIGLVALAVPPTAMTGERDRSVVSVADPASIGVAMMPKGAHGRAALPGACLAITGLPIGVARLPPMELGSA